MHGAFLHCDGALDIITSSRCDGMMGACFVLLSEVLSTTRGLVSSDAFLREAGDKT
jgi:hypothetical protein